MVPQNHCRLWYQWLLLYRDAGHRAGLLQAGDSGRWPGSLSIVTRLVKKLLCPPRTVLDAILLSCLGFLHQFMFVTLKTHPISRSKLGTSGLFCTTASLRNMQNRRARSLSRRFRSYRFDFAVGCCCCCRCVCVFQRFLLFFVSIFIHNTMNWASWCRVCNSVSDSLGVP